MPKITDPRVVRFLASRDFHPEPVRRDNRDERIRTFRSRKHDPDGTPHDVELSLTYSYGDNDVQIPIRLLVNTDALPWRFTVRVVGQNKWIANFDDAIAASLALARIQKKLGSKTGSKELKALATRILDGDFFANAHNTIHPGHPPTPQAGAEDNRPRAGQ